MILTAAIVGFLLSWAVNWYRRREETQKRQRSSVLVFISYNSSAKIILNISLWTVSPSSIIFVYEYRQTIYLHALFVNCSDTVLNLYCKFNVISLFMNFSDTFSVGVPMLGFGGVTFIAGILFTVLACISLKNVEAYQEQVSLDSSSLVYRIMLWSSCQLNCVALLGLERQNCSTVTISSFIYSSAILSFKFGQQFTHPFIVDPNCTIFGWVVAC